MSFRKKAKYLKMLAILTFLLSYWAKRSIHKFKAYPKFFGYFANAQYDNGGFSLCANALRSK